MRLICVLVVLCACHKPAGKELFGDKVRPPGILAKVHTGMTVAELEAIVPDLKNDPARGFLLAKPARNVKLYAIALDGLVTHTYVDLDGDQGLALLTAAWGPPDAEPDREEPNEVAWRNIETGWRASLFCGHGTKETVIPPFCTVTFHEHKPLEAMFAKPIAPPGVMANVKQDMSVAQFAAATHLPITKDTTLIRHLDYDGAVEIVSLVEGKLLSLGYTLPVVARPMIEKAWGPGTADEDGISWFDATSGWGASLATRDKDELRLEMFNFMPFERELDLMVAMASLPAAAEAQKAHPELAWTIANKDGYTDAHVDLPVNELTTAAGRFMRRTIVSVFAISGHGSRFVTQLRANSLDTIVASFTKRWGAPKKTVDKDVTRFDWPGHAYATTSDDVVSIQVGP